ncbi:uncharacterized protein BO80DRAFT_152110 [Aspergillus ibericus CBS 121593]|uniref:Transmembrane protein n=1 Tax=Aspergillus ibericus CBS 121593 TaxID=1448316 RepID=A0A395GTD8_9EURO|nr:hypothetical protein BO80DRAFT_152110 [Aspergillus ibericus CBS 121593]RAK98795.1 hypothetical protein BO80DRAFT_152110 [Aspergillus ibericus CBS 121593]
MYSIHLLWLIAVALSSPAVAQGILTSVNSQDGNGESESSSTTRNVSSKGMIILCTIVAVVVLVGSMSCGGDAPKHKSRPEKRMLTILYSAVLFTAAFITAKKRRLRTRETLPFTDPTNRPLGVRAPTGRGQAIFKGPDRAQIQPDLEKNAGVGQDRSHGDSDTKQRGWGSYFSFGRT